MPTEEKICAICYKPFDGNGTVLRNRETGELREAAICQPCAGTIAEFITGRWRVVEAQEDIGEVDPDS